MRQEKDIGLGRKPYLGKIDGDLILSTIWQVGEAKHLIRWSCQDQIGASKKPPKTGAGAAETSCAMHAEVSSDKYALVQVNGRSAWVRVMRRQSIPRAEAPTHFTPVSDLGMCMGEGGRVPCWRESSWKGCWRYGYTSLASHAESEKDNWDERASVVTARTRNVAVLRQEEPWWQYGWQAPEAPSRSTRCMGRRAPMRAANTVIGRREWHSRSNILSVPPGYCLVRVQLTPPDTTNQERRCAGRLAHGRPNPTRISWAEIQARLLWVAD